jgi:hypothetical protein
VNWKEKAVEAWREFFNNRAVLQVEIPVYEQVGKILEFCLLDVREAQRYIDSKIEEHPKSAYWPEVKTELMKLYLKDLQDLILSK